MTNKTIENLSFFLFNYNSLILLLAGFCLLIAMIGAIVLTLVENISTNKKKQEIITQVYKELQIQLKK
jgi:SNF family Na+-dependent transporter